jgi:DNA invertase Pin-like site-specific DNA recombinase
MTEENRLKVVRYVRLSKKNDKGVSIDAQRERIAAYAQLYELALVDVSVDDGASGKTLEQEGLQQALSLLESGEAEGVIVAKLDRLTRDEQKVIATIRRYRS